MNVSPDLIFVVSMVFFALIIVGIFTGAIWGTSLDPFRGLRFIHRLKNLFASEDGSILASQGLSEAELTVVSGQKRISGYDYLVLGNKLDRAMVLVFLGRSTNLHIVAVGDKSGLIAKFGKLRLRRFLTPLALEGDYPNYFSMYCSKGYEQELLQLFDPADMSYFVDFCRAYDFEIYNDRLYISQAAHAHDPNDTTSIVEDAKKFLKQNDRWFYKVNADRRKIVSYG